MTIHSLLLVDDDTTLLLSLKQALMSTYNVDLANDTASALAKLNRASYQCIILDVNLPGGGGLEICRQLRRSGNSVPIIILSGNNLPAQKAELLDAGADDYVTKPVQLVELEARLRTVIRRDRLSRPAAAIMHAGGVTLNSLQKTVSRDGIELDLRPKEFLLLECLMQNADRPVSRAVLLRYGWDDHTEGWTNIVDVHVKFLRDRLDQPSRPALIKTVYGVGYKFDASSVAKQLKKGKRYEPAPAVGIN